MEVFNINYAGEVAEWSKAADCKSAGVSLRRFESCPPHNIAGVAQLARASAFQAEGRGFESRLPLYRIAHVAQTVEHILGKDEVGGSSPLVGLKKEIITFNNNKIRRAA